ncbi:hypothetical protein LXL04_001893 [Taraxacum kok-saghyz]
MGRLHLAIKVIEADAPSKNEFTEKPFDPKNSKEPNTDSSEPIDVGSLRKTGYGSTALAMTWRKYGSQEKGKTVSIKRVGSSMRSESRERLGQRYGQRLKSSIQPDWPNELQLGEPDWPDALEPSEPDLPDGLKPDEPD